MVAVIEGAAALAQAAEAARARAAEQLAAFDHLEALGMRFSAEQLDGFDAKLKPLVEFDDLWIDVVSENVDPASCRRVFRPRRG